MLILMMKGVESYMEKMLEAEGKRVVKELSERFKFDLLEGMEHVVKVKVKVMEEENVEERCGVIMPFVGKKIENKCNGIRLNHGLYTQCQNNKECLDYCKTCNKQILNSSSAKPRYGTIDERIMLGKDYRDPKGKEPVKYGNVLEKLNISRLTAEKEAAKQGIIIAEEEFEIKRSQRGRPKKEVVTVDTSESDNEEVKPKRGRPKKNTKPITTNIGDDIINELKLENILDDSKKTNKESKKTKEDDSKKTKEDDSKKTKEEDSNKTNKEDSKKTKEEDSKKMKEEDSKKTKEETMREESYESNLVNNNSEDSDEEELAVIEFKVEGVKYLKAADDTIYNFKTHEEIGTWNAVTLEIEYE